MSRDRERQALASNVDGDNGSNNVEVEECLRRRENMMLAFISVLVDPDSTLGRMANYISEEEDIHQVLLEFLIIFLQDGHISLRQKVIRRQTGRVQEASGKEKQEEARFLFELMDEKSAAS